MNKMITTALTGAAVTAMVGTAAYMASGKSSASRKKKLRKNVSSAARAVGEVVSGISSVMK